MLTSGILNGCSDNKRICIEYREPGYFIEALARVVHQHLLPGFKILRNFTGKNDTFQKCLLTPSVSGERHDITALHTCLDLGWEAEKSTKSKREIAAIISRYNLREYGVNESNRHLLFGNFLQMALLYSTPLS